MKDEITEIEFKKQSNRVRVASLIILSMDIAGVAFLLFLTTKVLGKFEQIYNDLFEAKALPALTAMLISVPKTMWAVLFVAVGILMILKEIYSTDRTQTLLLNILILIICIVCTVICIIAFFLPLIGLPHGMSA